MIDESLQAAKRAQEHFEYEMRMVEERLERENALRLHSLISKNPYYNSKSTLGGYPVFIQSGYKVDENTTFLLGSYIDDDSTEVEAVWDMSGHRLGASVHSKTFLQKQEYVFNFKIYIKQDGQWEERRFVFMKEDRILYNIPGAEYAGVLRLQGNFYNYAFTAEETHLKDSMLAHEKDSLDGAQRFAKLEEINELLNEENIKIKEQYKNDPELKAENDELLNIMKTMELRYEKTVDEFQRWLQEEKARRVQAENEVEVLTMQLQSLTR